MRYQIITYGCQMNKSDSERIATLLESLNYQPVSSLNEADLIVINICSIRQSAVDRVYGLLPKFQKLKTINPKLKTILTGCLLEKDRMKFKNKFNFILKIRDLPNWPKILKPTHVKFRPWSEFYVGDYLKIKPRPQSNFRALIPISNGCNNFCSYCVVPFTRGPLFSRLPSEIIREVKGAIKKEFKEIWLLGQNVNDYCPSPNGGLGHHLEREMIDFPGLLKMINKISGNFWIRFTSSHPKNFSQKLIETITQSEKVTEYINLPVQSGDNQILKKMNRPYSVEEYKNLVREIRKKIPQVSLSTDVIVGFPGETKKQFENTLKLFQEIKFDMAYIAKYSERPGTKAAEMKDNLSPQEKEKREKILTKVLKKTALNNNKKYRGEILEVLVDKKIKGFLVGKTRNYKTVKFEGPGNLVGQFVKIKIIKAWSWGLKGKLIK